MLETSGTNRFRHWSLWIRLEKLGFFLTNACRWEMDFFKSTCFVTNCQWSFVLARLCNCSVTHKKVLEGGAACRAAAAYALSMTWELAQTAYEHRTERDAYFSQGALLTKGACASSSCPGGAESLSERAHQQRNHTSHLWSVQLSESLPWSPYIVKPLQRTAHINILEVSARLELAKRLPRDSKVVIGQDSYVSIGAGCRGRSHSPNLDRPLRREAAWIFWEEFALLRSPCSHVVHQSG